MRYPRSGMFKAKVGEKLSSFGIIKSISAIKNGYVITFIDDFDECCFLIVSYP